MSHGEHTPFHWFQLISPLEHQPYHVIMAVFVMSLLLLVGVKAGLWARGQIKKQGADGIIPEARINLASVFDSLVDLLYGFTESVMGEHDAQTYFPVVATLFLYVFVSNFLGLIPGFLPPTDNINVTLAAGMFVFFYYNIQGIAAHGLGYFKHFLGPVWYLAPLMLVIEIVSHLFRPISLALRLRGNIMGDHVVLHVFTGLTPYIVPVVFYAMGLFVCFVQAFVFCLLTMVYISLSTAHDHS